MMPQHLELYHAEYFLRLKGGMPEDKAAMEASKLVINYIDNKILQDSFK